MNRTRIYELLSVLGPIVRKLDSAIRRINSDVFKPPKATRSSIWFQIKLLHFKVGLLLHQLPGPYLQFYSFFNIFTTVKSLSSGLSEFRTTGPFVSVILVFRNFN